MRRETRYEIRRDDTEDRITFGDLIASMIAALLVWATVYALLWLGGAR